MPAPELASDGLHVRTRPPTDETSAVWLATGFRPFFLLAAGFAVFAMPAWLLTLFTGARVGGSAGAMHWHAHEMLFGFTVAVVAGFLLTAVARWTERETASGPVLGVLAAVWLAGRLAVLTENAWPGWAASAVDLAFLPMLAVVLARPIIASRNRRNYAFIGIIAALWVLDLVGHLEGFGIVDGWRREGVLVGVDLVVLAIVVVTGRVVPMFTRNSVGDSTIAGSPRLEHIAIAAVVLLLVTELLGAPRSFVALAAGAAAVATAIRTRRWGFVAALRDPMLWVLHVGQLWVPLGLGLRVAAELGMVTPVAATHALTAGAIGTLTLGMMVRVGLGHTGRSITASRPVVWAFAAMIAAAIVRVGAAVALPQWYRSSLVLAGALWTLAFAIYLITQTHVLTSTRVDGRPG